MTVNAAPTSAILATVWRAFNRLTRSGRTGISLPPHGRKPRGEAAHADRSLQAHEREPTKPSTLTANFRTEARDAPGKGQRRPGKATRAFAAVASRTVSTDLARAWAIAAIASRTLAGALSRPRSLCGARNGL